MAKFSVCNLGGVTITTRSGEELRCIARDGSYVKDNLLNSIGFVADLISGKIDNEEHNIVEFIDIAVQALHVLSTRLNDLNVK